jgi:hypothetical protein
MPDPIFATTKRSAARRGQITVSCAYRCLVSHRCVTRDLPDRGSASIQAESGVVPGSRTEPTQEQVNGDRDGQNGAPTIRSSRCLGLRPLGLRIIEPAF